MPTYEFRCPQGHDFEKFYRTISAASADSSVPCPHCGAVGERRMSAGAGLLFKGSGFYITDYGKDGKKDQRTAKAAGEGGGDAKAAGGATDAAGGKSESAPAAKPDSPASGTGSASGTSAGSTAPATPSSTPSGKSTGSSTGGTA